MKTSFQSPFATAFWEWQILRRQRGFQLTVLCLIVLSGFAIWSGSCRQRHWQETISNIQLAEDQDRFFLLSAFEAETDVEKIAGRSLSRNEKGRAETLRLVAVLPTSLAYFGGTTHATLFPSQLASISSLNIDRFPNRFLINAHSKRTVLERADIISPHSQMSGPFDLATLIGIVAPLFIIVLCYDVLSSEKEQGLLALACVQTKSPATRFGMKVIVRLVLPISILVVSILVSLLLSPSNEFESTLVLRSAFLIIATIVYLSCWGAICLFVNTFRGTSITNAIVLLATWCLCCVLIPTFLSWQSTTLFPFPTGTELVNREREIQADVREKGSELQASYYDEHPEDRPADAKKDRYGQARWDIISHHVDRRMESIMAEKYLNAEARSRWMTIWQSVSPATTWRSLVDELSGVSEQQFIRFQKSASDFHSRFKAYFLPGMMSRRDFERRDVENMPRYRPEVAGDCVVAWSLILHGLCLSAWLMVAAFATAVRLRRIQPV